MGARKVMVGLAANVVVEVREEWAEELRGSERVVETFELWTPYSLATTFEKVAELLGCAVVTKHRMTGNGGRERAAFGTVRTEKKAFSVRVNRKKVVK